MDKKMIENMSKCKNIEKGKIIEDENNEIIKIDMSTYNKLI
jgi:hypothetical protein